MSVRKRSWTTKRGDLRENWVADYVDQGGKCHIKTFAKKSDAVAYQAQTTVDIARGTHMPDSKSKTVAHAAADWIASCENAGLERSTLDGYRQHIKFHITPFIGRTKLSQLSAPMIREFGDRLRRGDPGATNDVGAPRSAVMAKKIIGSLGALLADAQERGLVSRNVVRELRSNRRRGKEKRAERRQKGKLKVGLDIPSPQEIKAIVGALCGRWRPFMLTAIFTGMRASELRGLRWADVDLTRREVHVRQRADRYKAIGKPKSEAGQRAIPLPAGVLAALREWKLACPPTKEDLVFPTSKGGVEYHSNVVKRALWPSQLRAGVVVRVVKDGVAVSDAGGKPLMAPKYTGLHALRHFYASWCINRPEDGGLGLPPKVVQERLGHSTIVMTLDVYGHLFPSGDDGTALDAAEKAFFG